jgi:hypothetical protein
LEERENFAKKIAILKEELKEDEINWNQADLAIIGYFF